MLLDLLYCESEHPSIMPAHDIRFKVQTLGPSRCVKRKGGMSAAYLVL